MRQFILQHGVDTITTQICSFGMTASDEHGEALVCKSTKSLTSSVEVARRVERKCTGDHRHVHLIAGKAKRAQLYPRAFSRAVCEGIAAEKRKHVLGLQHNLMMSLDEMAIAVEKLTGKKGPAEVLHEEEEVAFDDQSGAVLDPSLVRAARKAEIDYLNSMGV